MCVYVRVCSQDSLLAPCVWQQLAHSFPHMRHLAIHDPVQLFSPVAVMAYYSVVHTDRETHSTPSTLSTVSAHSTQSTVSQERCSDSECGSVGSVQGAGVEGDCVPHGADIFVSVVTHTHK